MFCVCVACLPLQLLRGSFPASAIKSYPDVFYVEYFAATEDAPGGDLFFFDYGVVACWWVGFEGIFFTPKGVAGLLVGGVEFQGIFFQGEGSPAGGWGFTGTLKAPLLAATACVDLNPSAHRPGSRADCKARTLNLNLNPAENSLFLFWGCSAGGLSQQR